MKRLRYTLLLAAFAAAVAPAALSRAQTAEQIRSYTETIDIRADGSIAVSETIVYDFGSTPHHGIYRDVPTTFAYDSSRDRVTPLTVTSVSGSPGTPADYAVESQPGGITRIKIGDPNRPITGEHTYTIDYTVRGALNAFPGHDELYWNAVGDAWAVPVSSVRVTVTAPAALTQVACFAGPSGSRLGCDRARVSGGSGRFSQASLSPHEALTVVAALPKGAVTVGAPILQERWSLARAFALTPATGTAAGGVLAVLVGVVVWLAWTKGRDRRYAGSQIDQVMGNAGGPDQPVPIGDAGESAPVEFAPPEGIRPGQVGTLIDERANTLDVTATIVDLAVRGFLQIHEIPKEGFFGKADWKLLQLQADDSALLPYEKKLYGSLFVGGGEVLLSGLKNTFSGSLTAVEDSLYADAVKEGWYRVRPDKARDSWHARGGLLFALGLVAVFVLAKYTHFGLVGVALVAGGFVWIMGARSMPARTAKGTAMLRRVRGFRTVIEKSEKYTSKWQEQENVFTTLLPYAVVFGVTDKWAKTFEALGATSDTSWYVSPNPFSYVVFAQAMDGFAVTTSGTIASVPASHGGSGFSGGGFSGGGFGGGGGGSW